MNYKLLLNTLVHLKPTQAFYQVKNRLYKPKFERFEVFDPSTGSGTGLSGSKWLVEPIPRPKCTEGSKFTFINIPSEFTDWNDPSRGMLWAYNQNYFDFINQESSTKEYGLYWIDKFIEELPSNKVGLDPYPIALRGINWIKFFGRYPETMTKVRVDSLYSQYMLLQKKLEYHLLGNHLLEDFYSLFIMSLYFGDVKYHQWVTRKLIDELDEEILKDGGHFEQSVMYHCILLDRLLDCINLASGSSFDSAQEPNSLNGSSSSNGLNSLKGYASEMLGWLKSMCYCDGSWPMFNDAALGIAPTPKEIFDYAERLVIAAETAKLGESGYRRISSNGSNGSSGSGCIEAFVDAGNITATYQPGHTHADALNYELHIDGKPVVVDTGISTYNKTARRQYERSTEAHNTVTIPCSKDQGAQRFKDCYEVWGGFRVGKRCKTVILKDSDTEITAQHDGYGSPCKRTWKIEDGAFVVEDHFEGDAISLIHLAPEVEVKSSLKGSNGLSGLNGSISSPTECVHEIQTNLGSIVIEGAKEVRIVDCKISREYNRFLDTKCIEIRFENKLKYTIK